MLAQRFSGNSKNSVSRTSLWTLLEYGCGDVPDLNAYGEGLLYPIGYCAQKYGVQVRIAPLRREKMPTRR